MKLVATFVLALLASWAAPAEEAKPTDDSIRQLFKAMQSSKLIDTYMTQIEDTVHASMQQALAGRQPNLQQQKILEDLGTKILALVKQELNWASLEPMMIEVYRDTFTKHEVDAMLAFYRSETGKSVVSKLPHATGQTMERLQARIRALTPQILELEKDAAAQIKAAGDAQQPPPQSAPQPSPPQPTAPAPQAQPPK